MMPVKRKGTQGTSEDRPIEDSLKKQTTELDNKVEERKIKDVIQKSLSPGVRKTGGPTKRNRNVEEKPALREVKIQG